MKTDDKASARAVRQLVREAERVLKRFDVPDALRRCAAGNGAGSPAFPNVSHAMIRDLAAAVERVKQIGRENV